MGIKHIAKAEIGQIGTDCIGKAIKHTKTARIVHNIVHKG